MVLRFGNINFELDKKLLYSQFIRLRVFQASLLQAALARRGLISSKIGDRNSGIKKKLKLRHL